MLSILHLFKGSVEFDSAKVLSRLEKEPVTGRAFCQARYKIDPVFFSDLCYICSEAYNRLSTTSWKGYRVLTGDGSTLNLPTSRQIMGNFGVVSNNPKKSLARIFLDYDTNTAGNSWKVGSRVGLRLDGSS